MFARLKRIWIFANLFVVFTALALSEEDRSKGFVYLHEIDPTILVSLRYGSNENFVGKSVDGYKKSVVIMTRSAALALKKVQEEVKRHGYVLVVYDVYRPQKAVEHFIRWAQDVPDQKKKAQYYPRIDKARVFELGYVAKHSTHNKGNRVDLTLIKLDKLLHPVEEKERKLLDGFPIIFLDDGTIDMGSSFDLFDIASHYENNVISESFKCRRRYLRTVMEKYGFTGYAKEWWHFTFMNELNSYQQENGVFNFDVE